MQALYYSGYRRRVCPSVVCLTRTDRRYDLLPGLEKMHCFFSAATELFVPVVVLTYYVPLFSVLLHDSFEDDHNLSSISHCASLYQNREFTCSRSFEFIVSIIIAFVLLS